MGYKLAAISDIGNVRQKNEDSYLVCSKDFGDKEAVLAVVADGMGGFQCGEKASQCVIAHLKDWWFCSMMPMEQAPDINAVHDMLCFVIETAHNEICRAMEAYNLVMGTTISLAFFFNGQYILLQAGDSRVYMKDKKQMIQLTKDQTWCQDEIDAGRLTLEEAAVHEKRHVLTNAVGNKEGFYIATEYGETSKGQMYLLCSDGYHAYLEESDFSTGMFHGDLQNMLDKSVERIKKGPAEDNLTAVLVEI